ncbi:MAG: sugar ABC transporter permease [Clostridiales bacterium]|nr:sugar ABC transporter permease [Clostridiales bacterium]
MDGIEINRKKKKTNPVAYVFVLPTIVLFGIFVIWPLIQTVYLSFSDWSGIGAIEFIGFGNYLEFFKDPQVWQSFKNNVLWMVVSCTVPIIIGLFQASLLVNSGIRHSKVFQLILFLPQVFSSVVAAVIWSWIYNPILGPLSSVMEALGLEKWIMPWLGNENTVMIALLIMSIWCGYGFNTVVYSAAIQGIDSDLYEAATMDGCGPFRKFFSITIPCVRTTSTTLLMFSLIGSFRVFDIVYQMTKGGPGYSSYVLSYHLYNEAFIKSRVGYGSTIAVILTIFILIISRLFLRVREGGDEA